MGTDIHYKFQKKDDDKWVEIDLEKDEWGDYKPPYYIGRSYLLFAVLAGVRNGRGFAGCYTHEPVVPISEPRGLPEDISAFGYEDRWGIFVEYFGEHSQSHLKSTEILEYFKSDKVVAHQGVITMDDYLNGYGGAEPERYCSGYFGDDVREFDATESVLTPEDVHKYTHVRVQWDMSVTEKLDYFRAMIQSLHESFGEVRFVFGFDS